jgi:hypothetical protein
MPPRKPTDDEPPRTVFEFERRRRGLELTEGTISDTIPRLPPTSPFAVGIDQATGREPSVDRSEDGTFTTTAEENQHDQG